jgi:hypothetical protein
MLRAAMGSAVVHEGGSDLYVADLFSYPAFPRFHFLAPLADGIYRRLGGNQWEATVYLGVVNIAVLAWLCLAAPRIDARLLTYVLCGMAVFCIFGQR